MNALTHWAGTLPADPAQFAMAVTPPATLRRGKNPLSRATWTPALSRVLTDTPRTPHGIREEVRKALVWAAHHARKLGRLAETERAFAARHVAIRRPDGGQLHLAELTIADALTGERRTLEIEIPNWAEMLAASAQAAIEEARALTERLKAGTLPADALDGPKALPAPPRKARTIQARPAPATLPAPSAPLALPPPVPATPERPARPARPAKRKPHWSDEIRHLAPIRIGSRMVIPGTGRGRPVKATGRPARRAQG